MRARASLVSWQVAGITILLLGAAAPVLAGRSGARATETRDLVEAMAQGAVSAEASGIDMSGVAIVVNRTGPTGLKVRVPAGTLFVNTGDTQDMVSRRSVELDLRRAASARAVVPATCVNSDREAPDEEASFEVSATAPEPELARLMELAQDRNVTQQVLQVGVWVVLDDIGRNDLDYLYRAQYSQSSAGGIVMMTLGTEPAASDQDVVRALMLLREAGVDLGSRTMYTEKLSLIAALHLQDRKVRAFALEGLGRAGADPTAALSEFLKDEEASVRWRAVYALGKVGDPKIIPALVELLGDDGYSHDTPGIISGFGVSHCVNEEAFEALIGMGSAGVGAVIEALRHHEEAEVRAKAAEALGTAGNRRAVGPLIGALRDEEVSVRSAAAGALGAIGDAGAVEPLVGVLKGEEEAEVRSSAAMALGQIGGTRATEALVGGLKDRDAGLRSAAADGLGLVGGATAVAALVGALGDEDVEVRISVGSALAQIGSAKAVESLVAALRDSNATVRSGAASALGTIGDKKAAAPLIALLRDPDAEVRGSAAGALGSIGDRRAIGPLREVAEKDEDEEVRSSAQAALEMVEGGEE